MLTKSKVSATLQRFPWIARSIVQVYRLSVPRFTAGVNGVLLDEQGRVFLVEHVFHAINPWGLPGGWVGRREEPAHALVREFQEETGIEVAIVRPIVVQIGQFWGKHLDISFLLEAISFPDEIQLSSELTNWGWFAFDELPSLGRFDQQVLDAVQKQMEKVSA
jgi:8-oxo-dGTP diphosphatase